MWPAGNGNFLKQLSARTISLSPRSYIFKVLVGCLWPPASYCMITNWPSLFTAHLKSGYTSLYLHHVFSVAPHTKHLLFIFSDPGSAPFKVLHISLEIRLGEERSVGEREFPWFMCQTQHWCSDVSHIFVLLIPQLSNISLSCILFTSLLKQMHEHIEFNWIERKYFETLLNLEWMEPLTGSVNYNTLKLFLFHITKAFKCWLTAVCLIPAGACVSESRPAIISSLQ